FAKVQHMNMLADWITHQLTGEFVTDPSIGSSSGMFDLARRGWSKDVIDICGMRSDVFPTVLEPGTVAGLVTGAAADATGLRTGTPVVVGGADTQLGLVGIGVVDPGKFTVIGGTFWQQTIGLGEAMIDPKARLRTLCHALPGQWMMEGIGFYSGLASRWFREAIDGAVCTGGASKGKLWQRIMADVLGLPVSVPRVKESTALGAAMFAGIGAGVYPDVATAARQVVSFEATVDPDPEIHGRYGELYEGWKRVYGGQLGAGDGGLLKP